MFIENDGKEELDVVEGIMSIVLKLAKDAAAELKTNWVKEDWILSLAARFEICVYHLFKIDYAACRRLGEAERGALLDCCEAFVAMQFKKPVEADFDHLSEVIAARMQEYGQRVHGEKGLDNAFLSLINGLVLKLETSGQRNRVEVNPPIMITGFIERETLTQGFIASEKHLEGFDFLVFLNELFSTQSSLPRLSGRQVQEGWKRYRAAV